MAFKLLAVASSASVLVSVAAIANKRTPTLVERQNPYPTGPQYDFPPLASITPLDPEFDENTLPVPTAYPAGSNPPIEGAPAIPDYTINPADWPADWANPPAVNSTLVQEWLQELEGVDIPDYAPNPDVVCSNPANAAALADATGDGRCWWTCGGCLRDSDITTCNNKWDFGLTFDDGPGLYTNKLLTYLDSKQIKSTFFLIGPRVISRPEVVVYEHMTGHELAVHGWSHTALTTLTNEEIVAELGWTRKAIKDVTGVTPRLMRPPYGDIDDRVRAISLAMGLIPVIWTAIDDGQGGRIMWDSEDWRVHGGTVDAVPNQARWEDTINRSGDLETGVVALQHDVYLESVDLAIGYTLPFLEAHDPAFNVQPVNICQGRPLGDAYVETNQGEDTPDAPTGSGVDPTASQTRTSSTGTSGGSGSAANVGQSSSSNLLGLYTGIPIGVTVIAVAIAFFIIRRKQKKRLSSHGINSMSSTRRTYNEILDAPTIRQSTSTSQTGRFSSTRENPFIDHVTVNTGFRSPVPSSLAFSTSESEITHSENSSDLPNTGSEFSHEERT